LVVLISHKLFFLFLAWAVLKLWSSPSQTSKYLGWQVWATGAQSMQAWSLNYCVRIIFIHCSYQYVWTNHFVTLLHSFLLCSVLSSPSCAFLKVKITF
jgi:hypothetical protein